MCGAVLDLGRNVGSCCAGREYILGVGWSYEEAETQSRVTLSGTHRGAVYRNCTKGSHAIDSPLHNYGIAWHGLAWLGMAWHNYAHGHVTPTHTCPIYTYTGDL